MNLGSKPGLCPVVALMCVASGSVTVASPRMAKLATIAGPEGLVISIVAEVSLKATTEAVGKPFRIWAARPEATFSRVSSGLTVYWKVAPSIVAVQTSPAVGVPESVRSAVRPEATGVPTPWVEVDEPERVPSAIGKLVSFGRVTGLLRNCSTPTLVPPMISRGPRIPLT